MAKTKKAFADMTVEELHDEATKVEIPGRSSMSKDELIAALEQRSKEGIAPAAEEAAKAEAPEAPPLLALHAPAEVKEHHEFNLGWTAAEGVTNVVIAGFGAVTVSPLRVRCQHKGTNIFVASAKDKDGNDVTARVSVNCV